MASSTLTNSRATDKRVNKTNPASRGKTFPYRPRVKGEFGTLDWQWEAVFEAQMRGGRCEWRANGDGRTVGGDDAMPRDWLPIAQLIDTLRALPRLPDFDDAQFTEAYFDALQRGEFLEVASRGKYRLRGSDGVILCRATTLDGVATYVDVREARHNAWRLEHARQLAQAAVAKASHLPAGVKA